MAKKILLILFVIAICLFTSTAFSANVSTLLEKGIYAEETKGDLDEAISIYQKIVDENTGSSANIAEAYYRLGTCYLKTGDEAKATEIFKELLNDFSEHEEIAVDAREQLVKLNALDEKKEEHISTPLELGPAPWESGETCRYSIKDSKGMLIAKIIKSIKEINIDGNSLWQLEDHHVYAGFQEYGKANILKESFRPVSGIKKKKSSIPADDYDYKVKYEKDNIRIINTANEKKDIPAKGIVYDSIEDTKLIRRLPLTQNYSASFNVFGHQEGQVTNEKITVIGKEMVTVPAGTFECYCLKVVMEGFPFKYKMWFSSDDKKYFVKMEAQNINDDLDITTVELEKISYTTVNESVEFNDKEYGISMTVPEGWNFIKNPKPPEPLKMILEMGSPELEVRLFFYIVKNTDPNLPQVTLQSMVKESEEHIMKPGSIVNSKVKLVFKNHTPRPESFVYRYLDGLPSSTYIADWDGKDKEMVAYWTYIVNEDYVGAFYFYLEKEKFDGMKADLDVIIKSVKWKH